MPEQYPYSPDQHARHQQKNNWLKYAALGSALVAGAVVLSPYVLPVVGIGDVALAEESMLALHGTGLGNGLAGTINTGINAIPLVGPTLARGGLITAATSGAIGIGGLLLGQFIDKRDDGSKHIRWGRVLSVAALATSALIALPSLLTGISVGVVFMAAVFSGVELASSAVALMASSLGSVGSLSAGATGLAGASTVLPHMLTCAAPAVPGIVSLGLLGKGQDDDTAPGATPYADDPATTSDGKLVVRVEPETNPPKPGQRCRVRMQVSHAGTGAPLTPDEIAPVHDEIIHFFLADESLRDFHHIHPLPTSTPGVYECEFTPNTAHRYNTWADIELKEDRQERRFRTSIEGSSPRSTPAYVVPASTGTKDGIVAHWESDTPLEKGVTSNVRVTFTDTGGNPITDLEPVVGAFVHMMGISKDSQHFMHPHPVEGEPTSSDDRGGPTFNFHITPDCDGPMQFYIQVKHEGREVFVPMGKIIKSPSLLSEKFNLRQAGQDNAHGYASL